ncbi:transposase [bacterium]|nr:transposase [bacterium]
MNIIHTNTERLSSAPFLTLFATKTLLQITAPNPLLSLANVSCLSIGLILIWNLRSALHLDLERFYDRMNGDLSCPDPSAFSRARAHLKPSAFRAFNDQLIETATDFGLRNNTWHDLRLLAIDGSTCRLPKASPDIAAYFGGTTSRHETFTPMARISHLCEVRTHLIIDGQISPYAVGEHAQAHGLLGGNVWNGDCVLFDRGYNDPKGIAWILTQDSYFVRRVAVGNDKAAQDFVASGEAELEFDYTFKKKLDQRI